ncbi:MAG: hypothetical protein OXG60_14310, partial [Chloroflexi bacterium]|nr:hypothetical protein [Chloroflexota bacterium]
SLGSPEISSSSGGRLTESALQSPCNLLHNLLATTEGTEKKKKEIDFFGRFAETPDSSLLLWILHYFFGSTSLRQKKISVLSVASVVKFSLHDLPATTSVPLW